MSALVLMNTIANFETASRPSLFWYLMVCLIVPVICLAVAWGLGVGLARRKAFDDNDRAAGLTAAHEHREVAVRRAAATEQPAVASHGVQGHGVQADAAERRGGESRGAHAAH